MISEQKFYVTKKLKKSRILYVDIHVLEYIDALLIAKIMFKMDVQTLWWGL